MSALILVDLQNDFLPGGALAVPDGDAILPVVNELLKSPFTLILASKDWHPPDHESFAQTQGKKVNDVINLHGLSQILWPVHCVQGTLGAEFSNRWNHDQVKQIVYKGTDKEVDSYSAFFDNNHHKSTGLHPLLQKEQIQDLYIAGLATDYCVKYTVLDAVKLGYQVYVIIDACKPIKIRPDDEEKAIQEMLQAGAKIMSSKDLISQ